MADTTYQAGRGLEEHLRRVEVRPIRPDKRAAGPPGGVAPPDVLTRAKLRGEPHPRRPPTVPSDDPSGEGQPPWVVTCIRV